MTIKNSASTARAVLVWGVSDIYFMVSVVTAILLGMLSSDVQKQLHLNSIQLGLLGSAFFLSYGLAQLISGRMLDFVGPRLTLSISAVIASVGLYLFAISDSFAMAIMAQILSGMGLSTSYIGAIYLARLCFAADRFSLVAGVTQMSASLMSAIVLLGLAAYGDAFINFRMTMNCLALAVFSTALLMLIVVQSVPAAEEAVISKNIKLSFMRDLFNLLCLPQYWLGAIYFSASFGTLLAFSNLWSIPYQLSYGHSLQLAAMMSAMIPLGGAFGAVLAGWLAGAVGSRSRVAMFYSSGMLLTAVIMVYGPHLPIPMIFVLFAVLGFFFGGFVLGFPLVDPHMRPALRGTGYGLMGAVAYLTSALLQYLVGVLLGDTLELPGGLAAVYEFRVALTPLIVALAIGWIASRWLRD